MDPESIATHATNYFSNLFDNVVAGQDFPDLDEIIPSLMTSQMNFLMRSSPSMEKIQNVVFNLRKISALGPDGFGGFFYQTY